MYKRQNYESFELAGLGPLTVLVGPNAVGKTNVVEGVQLLTALQSFRRPSLDQMVRQGAGFARLDADVTDGSRELALSLQVSGGKKRYLLNGKGKRTADLKGLVPSVTFTPDDLEPVSYTHLYLRVGFYGLQPRTPGYTQRRLRPLARRADRTARPPFVDMRARKPWHLARLRVLG